MVSMSELRELFESLGFTCAKTLLQSGNVVFKTNQHSGAALERLLETETAKRLSVSPDYIVRTAAEWEDVTAHNPFPKEAKNDPGHLVVMFLKAPPQSTNVNALEAANRGREVIRADGKELYLVYPDGIGRSKLTGNLIEQKLGIRGTARNWNTVLKLRAHCETAE
jgi:uncharacterized protein (DUF1697 family)